MLTRSGKRLKHSFYFPLMLGRGEYAAEYIAFVLGGIYYDHGWALVWSFVLLFIAFALVRLHYKKPLFVWIPSLACGAAMALIFKLPYPR